MRTIVALLFGLSLALAGCATRFSDIPPGIVVLPQIPAWQQPAQARTYTAQEVVAECALRAPFALVELSDATFTPVSHEWLNKATRWSWEFARDANLRFQIESFDCDKFALGFALMANFAASRAGVQAQPLVARIHVKQRFAFGRVEAGGYHALNAFLSDRGIYVYEPQSQSLVRFEDYANRETIIRIKIGG